MKEIKFRAWDTENKKWYRPSPFTLREAMAYHWIHENPVVELLFSQYTGVKDRNGEEIYEGDIVRNSLGSLWHIGSAGFFEDAAALGDVCKKGHKYEIVGNIYQNPDLLTS